MNILHITAHLGGGIGQAVSALVQEEKKHTHRIMTLEPLIKTMSAGLCRAAGAEVIEQPRRDALVQELRRSDLVILHWWDHPLMAAALADFPSVPVRCVLWCHISGCDYPVLPFALLDKAQHVFFTTPYSYENREWSEDQREQIWAKSSVVYGSGLLQAKSVKTDYRLRQGGARIGYAGTFARSKMNDGFVSACRLILDSRPDSQFLLAGDPEAGVWIAEQAEAMGIAEHIHFLGYLHDMNEFWEQIDIFGYPLNPQHFGTTENVVLEALAAGLPVVLLRQAAEAYILSDPSAGVLADGLSGYAEEIASLCGDEERRRRLGKNAVQYVRGKYAYSQIVKQFQREAERLSGCEKRVAAFQDVLGSTPIQWLLHGMPSDLRAPLEEILNGGCTREEERAFWRKCPYILKEHSKSSIPHFLRTFPEDRALQSLYTKLKLGE